MPDPRRIRLMLALFLAVVVILTAALMIEGWRQSNWRDFF